MLTYEDVTGYFLKTASDLGLTTHPEHWMNSHTLEREFACTCHTGNCEEAENHSACTISFTWSTLDTALSLEGPTGICDFFHEPDQHCPHLHTRDIPALVLDLSYSLTLNGSPISDTVLLSLLQMLKLRASARWRALSLLGAHHATPPSRNRRGRGRGGRRGGGGQSAPGGMAATGDGGGVPGYPAGAGSA